MSITRTDNLHMRHVSENDIERIFKLYNNPETRFLWLPDEETVDLERFRERLKRRIAHRWDHYVVFEQPSTQRIVGFAYCYQASDNNKTASLCICIDKPYMNSTISLKAAFLYIAYLFEHGAYRKVYAEVFAYNKTCIRLLSKLQFEQEGCLKEFQWWQDRYWDQYIFSLTRNSFDRLKTIYQSILNRPSWNTKTN
jgi:ribosomal-protein-alanine N-acetyltransferase